MTKRVSADLVVGAAVGGCGDGLSATEVVLVTVGLVGTGDELGRGGAVEASTAASLWVAVISAGVARDCSGTAVGVQAETVTTIDPATTVLMRDSRVASEHIVMIIHNLPGR